MLYRLSYRGIYRFKKNFFREQVILFSKECSGDDLGSREVALQVLSALRSLTTVFGMGTGVTFLLLSPNERFASLKSQVKLTLLSNVLRLNKRKVILTHKI